MSSIILILVTFIVTLVGKKFGKNIFKTLHKLSGIVVDEVSREEAAMIFLEKIVEIKWRPLIIEEVQKCSVVRIEDFKCKKQKNVLSVIKKNT